MTALNATVCPGAATPGPVPPQPDHTAARIVPASSSAQCRRRLTSVPPLHENRRRRWSRSRLVPGRVRGWPAPRAPGCPHTSDKGGSMTVGIEHAGPVTVLTLDRPEARNAVDAPTATASLHSDPQTHGLRHLGAASTHLPRMRLPQRQGCVARLRQGDSRADARHKFACAGGDGRGRAEKL